MLKVYNYMAAGLGISGFTAILVQQVPAIAQLAAQLNIVLLIAMVVMVFAFLPRMHKMSEGGALATFFGYAALFSFAISPMFIMYTNESLIRTFFITSGVFLAMSIYGYSTKKDLTSLGTFAMIGIWGVFISAIINMFLQSPTIHYIASAVAIVAVVALTAYDTQKIKQTYYQVSGGEQALQNKAAIIGALQLYFDFVYLFVHLMQFLGDRR
jgi:hypothetical protein